MRHQVPEWGCPCATGRGSATRVLSSNVSFVGLYRAATVVATGLRAFGNLQEAEQDAILSP